MGALLALWDDLRSRPGPFHLEMRGASNARAKRELGWQPKYATWRSGFAETI